MLQVHRSSRGSSSDDLSDTAMTAESSSSLSPINIMLPVMACHDTLGCLTCSVSLQERAKARAMATALSTINKFVIRKKTGENGRIFGR